MNKFILLATAFAVLSPSLSYGMEEDSTPATKEINYIATRKYSVENIPDLQPLPSDLLEDIFNGQATFKGKYSFRQSAWKPWDYCYFEKDEKFKRDLQETIKTIPPYYSLSRLDIYPEQLLLEIFDAKGSLLTAICLIGTKQ